MIGFVAKLQPAVRLIVRQAVEPPLFGNVKVSKRRGPVPSGPGHPFGAAQPLGLPSRPRRAVCCPSPDARLPLKGIGAPPEHVGRVKWRACAAWWSEVTLSVKSIGVPHTNVGSVVKAYVVRLLPEALIPRFGYAESAWLTITPGVAVVRVAEIWESARQPSLLMPIVSLMHSSRL